METSVTGCNMSEWTSNTGTETIDTVNYIEGSSSCDKLGYMTLTDPVGENMRIEFTWYTDVFDVEFGVLGEFYFLWDYDSEPSPLAIQQGTGACVGTTFGKETWYNVIINSTDDNVKVYIDGIQTCNITAGAGGNADNFTGFIFGHTGNVNKGGGLDNFTLGNYSSFFLLGADTTPPIITLNYPSNDTIYNNYSKWINLSSNEYGSNCTLNDTRWSLTDNSEGHHFRFYYAGFSVDGLYHIEARCNDSSNNNASLNFSFISDTTNPILIGFNITVINNANITFNYTATDPNLEKFELNCTNTTGHQTHYNLTTNITSTSFNYNKSLNSSSWGAGISRCYSEICDGHTDNKISIKPVKDGDNIKIDPETTIILNDPNCHLNKIDLKTDRAEYEYVCDKKTTNTQFIMSTDWYPVYMSKFLGHVIHPIKNLWHDFVSNDVKNVDIIRFGGQLLINIEFKTAVSGFSFSSTGELNCINRTFSVTINTPPVTPQLNSPANETIIYTNQAVLNYNSSDIDNQTINYSVYLAINTGGFVIYSNTINQDTTVTGLLDGYTIKWMVVANDGTENSPNSTVRTFTVDNPSTAGGGGSGFDISPANQSLQDQLSQRTCSNALSRVKGTTNLLFSGVMPSFLQIRDFFGSVFDWFICGYELTIVKTQENTF